MQIWCGPETRRDESRRGREESLRHIGVRHPLFPPERCEEVIARTREFFDLPADLKKRLAIEQSLHFRGYSVMESARDWREQIHFGREETARDCPPAYQQLRGPNQLPDDPAWGEFLRALMHDLEIVARAVLDDISESLGLPRLMTHAEEPYLLLKMIHYRPSTDGIPRSGVAPHVDFSWITLLLQDEAGGLEVLSPDGEWKPVEPVPGTLVVHAGEILEFATGGRCQATPHRVRSGVRSRVSLPFFLNPSLDARIAPVSSGPPVTRPPDPEHVHRVFASPREAPFVYGDEEWQRKGLNRYCEVCCPLPYGRGSDEQS